MNKRTGLTLLEILLVVSIVALLAALMFPAVSLAKRSARQSSCVSQLRQVGMALSMYEAEHGLYPSSFEILQRSGLLKEKSLLLCPIDSFGGYASRFDACSRKTSSVAFSYDNVLAWFPYMLTRLEQADSNHGVVACRLHGSRTARYSKGLGPGFCDYAWHMFEGTLLRLRKDGSVQTARLTHRRSNPWRGFSEVSVGVWELFTDEPEPKR